MAACTEKHHANHTHKHGPKCGHTAVRHGGHVDYLHDGHLHHMHGDHVDEHVIAVDAANPVKCTPEVHCSHGHCPNCGHEEVPHGDHVDYLVDGRLHSPKWAMISRKKRCRPFHRQPSVRRAQSSPWAMRHRMASCRHVT